MVLGSEVLVFLFGPDGLVGFWYEVRQPYLIGLERNGLRVWVRLLTEAWVRLLTEAYWLLPLIQRLRTWAEFALTCCWYQSPVVQHNG